MLDTPRSPFLTKAANVNEQTSSTTQAKVMELLSPSVLSHYKMFTESYRDCREGKWMSKENALCNSKTDSSQVSNSTLHTDHVDRGQAVQNQCFGSQLVQKLLAPGREALCREISSCFISQRFKINSVGV